MVDDKLFELVNKEIIKYRSINEDVNDNNFFQLLHQK